MTTVVFSVSPSHNPTGTLVPSAVMTSAATQQVSANTIPSIINAATSRPARSRASSSSRAFVVAALNLREIAERESPRATASRSAPIGSATSTWRRVATPASTRSTANWVSRSVHENTA